MKMEISAVFVILMAIISRISAESNCRTLSTDDGRRGMYSCVRATLDDLNDISDEAEWIRFTVSILPHLPERAFARFALQGLSFYNCEIDDIHPNAFDGLDKLRRLTFHGSYILVLKASWFKGLSSLTHLLVDRDDLVYIEPDVFPLLSNLELLNIEDNNLNCLPSQALAPLRKLKRVRIGKNPWLCSCYAELVGWMKYRQIDYGLRNTTKERLECMMEHVPQYRDFMVPFYKVYNTYSVSETGYIGMSRARDVMSFGNNISALSQIPDNVKSIKFVNSQISKIPRFAFLRFGNSLTSLYFRNCSIRDIHPDAFAGLPKLEMLFLFDNSFSTVRSEWFRDLHSLENLALDKNGIEYIQPSVFPLLDKLKHLSLGNNRIECISINEFNSLKHLKEVILAHNPWNCSCQENFRKWLHENRVRYVISRGQCVNGKIQESEDLFEQSFERYETKMKSQSTGEIMSKHERQNQAGIKLDDDISTDTGTYLEAQLNEIREAEADHNRNIKIANYEYYRLEAEQQDEYSAQETHPDGNSFTDLKSEDDVSISSSRGYNELDKVTKNSTPKDLSVKLPLSDVQNSYITFGGTIWDVSSISTDATAIRFQNSAIPKIFNIFSRFGSTLRRLEFLNCMVRDIEPQAFRDLTNLQELVLSDNQIQEVRSAWFDGIPNLRRLSLARNSITRIDNGVFQLLTNLEQLELSNNQLNCLNVEGLSHLTNLNTINIGNNPWSCRCQRKLIDWLDQHEDYIQDFSAEIGDRDCSAEYTDFRMTNNQDTNSIDEVHSDAEKEIEGLRDVEEIKIAQEVKKARETILTVTENSKVIEAGNNSAALKLTATETRETVPTTTTTKPEYFNTHCGMRENRWWCNGGDISVLNEIPSNAERIDIINANIPVIPVSAFIRFPNLTRLLFYHSNVREVEPLAFNTLVKLEWLVFLNNSMPIIRSSWFHGLGNLNLLGLVRNSITEIESDVFDHLTNLKRLSISENNLRCIYTKSLSSLKYLERVMIQNNPWKWRCREELSQFFDARNISYVMSETYEGKCVVTDLLTDEISM